MPLDYPLTTTTLDNGLQVVISPDHAVPVVAINIWVNVGSAHEKVGRTGFAHLFEHLMFQGSEHVANGEHFEAIMAAGGRCNATTWFDRTNYFETVPTGALELALWLEADRHSRLLAALTQENLDNQRDVVVQEKRQRYDNQPYGNALAHMYATVFPKGHPYHHPTIGSMEDLAAASLEDVHNFFRQHYAPDNTVLTLVGDIEPARGIELVQRYFGSISAHSIARPEPTPPLPPLPEPARLTLTEEVPNERLYLGFRLPPDDTPEFLACSIALDALAGLISSPLEQKLVRGGQQATSISTSAMGLVRGVSLGLIVADIAPTSSAAEVEELICEELLALGATGPSREAMQAVRAGAQRHWLGQLASFEDRADAISQSQMLLSGAQRINTFLDDLDTIDAMAVTSAARTYLNPRSRAVVTYLEAS